MNHVSFPEMVVNDRYVRVHYVDEGMRLIAPVKVNGRWTGMRVVVTCAAGEHARVASEANGFEDWRHIRDLRRDVRDRTPEVDHG